MHLVSTKPFLCIEEMFLCFILKQDKCQIRVIYISYKISGFNLFKNDKTRNSNKGN